MADLVKDILDRAGQLRADFSQWANHFQELSEVMLPRRADFTTSKVAGAKRTERLYDGVPLLAPRGLATAIDGLLKPKTSPWFHVKANDDDLNELDEVKQWFNIVDDRVWNAIYAPKARFLQASGAVDRDLVVFGTGELFVGLSRDQSHIMFKATHLRDGLIAENDDGLIDTNYTTFKHSARNAERKWGFETLGAKTKEALKGPNAKPDKEFSFTWAVQPREERNPSLVGATNLPVASVVVDVTSEHIVEETGFHEFPFMVPRWDVASGEVYGRSPGMLALPDVNTDHQMGKTLLRAGHKAVDPPMQAPDDSSINMVHFVPGKTTFYDVELARQLRSTEIIRPINTGGNIPLGREMQNDTRQQIFSAFFRDVLNLPLPGERMTATEILERKEEFIRTVGPVLGQLESDYLAPTVERVFNILVRLSKDINGNWIATGPLPPPPEVLRVSGVRFEYASPIVRARKAIEVAAAGRQFEVLAPLADARPELWDNYDVDQIARDTAEGMGLPQKWLLPKAVRDENRRVRAEREEQLEQAALAEQAAGGVANLAKASQAVQ